MNPTCPKCENTSFSLKEVIIKHSIYQLNAVCCDKCGCIITTMENRNISDLVLKLAKELDKSI
jgi:predicted nucleic-acid-binding Zn-ribbon protein